MRKNEKNYKVTLQTTTGAILTKYCIEASNPRQAAKIARKMQNIRVKSPLIKDTGDALKIMDVKVMNEY